MAKKEATESKPEEDSIIYFVANHSFLSAAEVQFLADKPYYTLNNAFRKFKSFVGMLFTSQRVYDLERDAFWRLDRKDTERFIVGNDDKPVEIDVLAKYSEAVFVGYDDIRFAQINRAIAAANEKQLKISTKLTRFVLE